MTQHGASSGGARPSAPHLTLDWHSGEFSDWECSLGDERFKVHRNVLALGSRSSEFFRAAFRKQHECGDAARTDLTVVLPEACHAHVKDALDFMYGHVVAVTEETFVFLYKIA